MVHAKTPLQHFPKSQDLRQLLVSALEPSHRSVKEQVDLALLSGGGEVHVRQGIGQRVHLLLGEAEHHCWQQRSAQPSQMELWHMILYLLVHVLPNRVPFLLA